MFSGGIEIGQWLKMGQRTDLLTKIALFQAVFAMWTHHHGRKNNQQLKEMVQSIILTIINCFLWNISVFREKQMSKFLVTFTVALYYLLQMKGLWEKLFSNCRNFYRVKGVPQKNIINWNFCNSAFSWQAKFLMSSYLRECIGARNFLF